MIVFLTACAGPSDKPPGETADSVPPETGESITDSETDTEDSDTGEDTADTGGETGDTAPPIEWLPGDDIPGWEDADCAEPYPGRAYTFTYPDTYVAEGTFLDGLAGVGPHLYTIQQRDCDNFPCAADSFDTSQPHVSAVLDGTAGDDGLPRGIGEWGPDARGVRQVEADSIGLLVDWSNDSTQPTPAAVTVCITRMRPDEVRGTVRAEVSARDYPYVLNFYDTLVYRFEFDILYPDHGGFDATLPDIPEDQPDGYAVAHFTYEQPYDAAWPWDDITDPSIREQVYERYTPYNTP